MAAQDRKCAVCGVTKPLSEFPKHTKQKYYKRTCKPCTLAKQASYKYSSPETYLWSRLGRQNSASQKVPVEITKEYLKELWDEQDGKCAVTGLHMTYYPRPQRQSTGLNASVDRIDSSGTYSKGNVRLVCSRVNMMKGAGEDADMLWWCKSVMAGLEGD